MVTTHESTEEKEKAFDMMENQTFHLGKSYNLAGVMCVVGEGIFLVYNDS